MATVANGLSSSYATPPTSFVTVVVAEGSIDRSLFPVWEIRNAVRHDGMAFAVAHNHPSGDPTPSESDLQAAAQLPKAAETLGLRLLAA